MRRCRTAIESQLPGALFPPSRRSASVTGLCVARWLSWEWAPHVPFLERVTAEPFEPFSCIAGTHECRPGPAPGLNCFRTQRSPNPRLAAGPSLGFHFQWGQLAQPFPAYLAQPCPWVTLPPLDPPSLNSIALKSLWVGVQLLAADP